jgi:hypothetical protein
VVLAVLTPALGSGGLSAIISVARPLLLEPLPYHKAGDVGVLWHRGDWTEQEFLYLQPQFQGFRSMAAYHPMGSTLEMDALEPPPPSDEDDTPPPSQPQPDDTHAGR